MKNQSKQTSKTQTIYSYCLNFIFSWYLIVLKEDFIKDHLKNLENVWINGIKTNSKLAIKAFVALLRIKSKDSKEFIQKVIANLNKLIDTDIDTIRSYSKLVVSIVDYYAAIKQINLEANYMSLVELTSYNYHSLLNTNTNCILSYVDFISKIFQAGFRAKTTLSKF